MADVAQLAHALVNKLRGAGETLGVMGSELGVGKFVNVGGVADHVNIALAASGQTLAHMCVMGEACACTTDQLGQAFDQREAEVDSPQPRRDKPTLKEFTNGLGCHTCLDRKGHNQTPRPHSWHSGWTHTNHSMAKKSKVS